MMAMSLSARLISRYLVSNNHYSFYFVLKLFAIKIIYYINKLNNSNVTDVTPPKLSCPQSYVIELVDKQESYSINFNETRRRINATDASGSVKISFLPERAVIRTGSFENVTVYAMDSSGNRATCHFQVSVQATPCVYWELKPPVNGDLKCVSRDNKGLQCIATCKAGYRFTDGAPVKTFDCEKRWVPTSVVPDCVSESKSF